MEDVQGLQLLDPLDDSKDSQLEDKADQVGVGIYPHTLASHDCHIQGIQQLLPGWIQFLIDEICEF